MGAHSLEVFKVQLDGALGGLILWVADLPMAVALELDRFSRPYQLKPFSHSMNTCICIGLDILNMPSALFT